MDKFIILLTIVLTKKAGEVTEQMRQMSRKGRTGIGVREILDRKTARGRGCKVHQGTKKAFYSAF